MFAKNDRIELISMSSDPDPIPVGTKGTVRSICTDPFNRITGKIVGVNWDNGRRLNLILPTDTARKIEG